MAMLWHYSISMLYLIRFLHIDFAGHLLVFVIVIHLLVFTSLCRDGRSTEVNARGEHG